MGKVKSDICQQNNLLCPSDHCTLDPTLHKCPKKCHCFYQPKNRRTVVNCTGVGLTLLLQYVPEGENLTLLFEGNNIESFEQREYFNRSYTISLSNNQIHTISSNAIESIGNNAILDLSGNKMYELPRDFQSFNLCITKLGKIQISCDCDDECWNNNCSALGNLWCIVYIPLRTVYFKEKCSKVYPYLKYDVFISFDDNDTEIRIWVIKTLASYLQDFGYRIFIPCRNEKFGDVREEALIDTINICKKYMIILCDKYHTEQTVWTTAEWKYI
ncbi:uncharacterized protein LOC127724937 [Mytilus californianus]|uniref:uncharacterized protein LOC127724937 n=1 Tax=Mytilus californianus TaxID=6549 RepID=UPI0022484B2F|nr:uncharacterized protein LOC127724937 [Mytilus californianus]